MRLSNLNKTTLQTFYKNELEANMQGRILAYKKLEYSKHTKEKLHIKFYVQKYGKKNIILFQKIFSYIVHKGT
jgi:hypothetical protein